MEYSTDSVKQIKTYFYLKSPEKASLKEQNLPFPAHPLGKTGINLSVWEARKHVPNRHATKHLPFGAVALIFIDKSIL